MDIHEDTNILNTPYDRTDALDDDDEEERDAWDLAQGSVSSYKLLKASPRKE